MAEAQKRITDIGPPDYKQFLSPVVKENYGKWKYHEILEPGVLLHVGESGDELYTVRVGSCRLVSTDFIRDLATLEYVDRRPVLVCEDAKRLGALPPQNLDCVVTSPPYLNGTNYFRNSRLELWFLRCLNHRDDLAAFRRRAIRGASTRRKTASGVNLLDSTIRYIGKKVTKV